MEKRFQYSDSFGHSFNKRQVGGWEAEYIRYHNLQALLETRNFDDAEFEKQVFKDLDRVSGFVTKKVADLATKLQDLDSCHDVARIEEANQAIEKVDMFVVQNLQGFQKILQKYTEHTKRSDEPLKVRLNSSRLKNAQDAIHSLIVQLSDIYKAAGKQSSYATEVWKPPDSFSRKTTKYWVKPEDSSKVKLFVIRHLPVLEITRSARVVRSDQNLDQTHNLISSIYFDNDQLGCYHRRIMAEEGARLLRVRWYGGTRTGESELPLPTNEKVYVEMKTHHENWTQMESTKERFPLTRQLLPALLNGTMPPSEAFQEMVRQGLLSEKEATKHGALAEEVQEFVQSERLRPLLRTFYHRTAFQSSTSNAVRISFDMPCYFFLDGDRESLSQWASFSKLRARQDGMDPFQYGVFEIKIAADDTPAWIEELLETGMLQRVDKFSKFQHTVATNLADKCSITPYWIESMEPTSNRPPLSVAGSKENHNTLSLGSVSQESVSQGSSELQEYDGSRELLQARRILGAPPGTSLQPTASRGSGKASSARSARTNLVRTKVEPKTYFANERTFIQWLSASLLLVTLSVAIMTLGETARLVGTIFVPVALVFMIYSLGLYLWRQEKIKARDGSRLHDPYGPAVLTLVLSAAMVVTVAMLWIHAPIEGGLDPGGEGPLLTDRAALPPLSHLASRHSSCQPLAQRASVAGRGEVELGAWVLVEELGAGLCASPEECIRALRTRERRLTRFYKVFDLDVYWNEDEDIFCLPDLASDCALHQVRRRSPSGSRPGEVEIARSDVDAIFLASSLPQWHGRKTRSEWEVTAMCEEHVVSHVITVSLLEPEDDARSVFPVSEPVRTLENVGGSTSFEVSGGAWHPGWQKMVLVGDGDGGRLFVGDMDGGQTWEVDGAWEGVAVADPNSMLVYLLDEADGTIHEWSRDTEAVTRRFELLGATSVAGGATLTDADKKALVDGSRGFDSPADTAGAEGLAFVPDEFDSEGGVFWVASQENGFIYRFRLSVRSGGTSVQFLGSMSHWLGTGEIASLEYDWECGVVLASRPSDLALLVLNRDGTVRAQFHDVPGQDQEALVVDSSQNWLWFGEDATNTLKQYQLPGAKCALGAAGGGGVSGGVTRSAQASQWQTAGEVNRAVGAQLYEATAALELRETRHSIRYAYKLKSLAGADAEVSWVVTYGSDEHRAAMLEATRVAVEVRVTGARPSLAALRQAEALMELLRRPGSDIGSEIAASTLALIVLGVAAPVLLFVFVVLVWGLCFWLPTRRQARKTDPARKETWHQCLGSGLHAHVVTVEP